MQHVPQKSTFKIIKFEPNDIQMLDIESNKVYNYVEVESKRELGHTQNPLIVQASPLGPGYVYPKEMTTLKKVLQPRCETAKKAYFQADELDNTFAFMVQLAINKKSNFYGYYSPQNILISPEGQIRIKDPKLCRSTQFCADDLQALGFILFQCCILKSEKQCREVLQSNNKYRLISALNHYSIRMIANVWIMTHRWDKLYSHLDFGNNSHKTTCKQYDNLLEEIKKLREKIFSPSPKTIKKFNPEQLSGLSLNFEKKTDNPNSYYTDKKIIMIPPLNFNLQKRNIVDSKKLEFSAKKQKHNENFNEENNTKFKSHLFKKLTEKQKTQKIGKEKGVFANKNQRIKSKNQESQVIKLSSPIKSRSRTFGKKVK